MKSKTINKGGRPLKFKTEQELQEKIEAYFKSCWTQKLDMWGNPIFKKDDKGQKTEEKVMEQTKPYTLGGLAVFLDCDREIIADYEAKGRFLRTIKKARDIIHAYNEERLHLGGNAVGTIFNLKNNWGWQDKREEDHRFPDGLPIQVVSYEDVKPNKNG